MEKLSPYEQSRVYQIKASIAGAQNDYDGVRKNMQGAIASGGLNDEEMSGSPLSDRADVHRAGEVAGRHQRAERVVRTPR